MRTQEQWMQLYKEAKGIPSDRKLAFHWHTTTAEIRHLKTGKRKLSVARKIVIAQALELDPLQIFISCDYYKAHEDEKDFLQAEYMKSIMRSQVSDVPQAFYKRRRLRAF